MLTINNLYAHGFNPAHVDRLRRLGFKFRPQSSTFAGSQVLNFADFNQGPALEFIQVENAETYNNFLPPGMVAYCPGINLLIPPESSLRISDYLASTQAWSPYLIQFEDDDDEPDRPTWRYLNFEIPVIKDTFLYLSAFDGQGPIKSGSTNHPNGVGGVVELIFNLEATELAGLSSLIKTEIVEDNLKIGDVRIISRSAWAGQIALPEKQFPLVAVVLQASTLDYFKARNGVVMIEYRSKPAAHVKTNELSWDLIVTT